MTRDKLIEFLLTNYEPDTQLIWTTATSGDVRFYLGSEIEINEQLWTGYLESANSVYDRIAQAIAIDYTDYYQSKIINDHKNKGDNN